MTVATITLDPPLRPVSPGGLPWATSPVITPCPACHQPTVTRLAGDIDALYECSACGWRTVLQWADLEQHQQARRSAPSVEENSSRGGRMAVTLPTEPRKSAGDPMSSRVLLVGHPKVGKSTCLAAWAPQTTLILDTHAGTKMIPGDHYVNDITSFDAFVQAVDLIVKGDHPFKTIGIDTIDDIYRFADKRAGQNHKKLAAGLVEFGKGSKEADALFFREIEKLLATPYGIWFLGHAETEQVDSETRYVPKLDKRVRSWIEGVCDFNWFAQRVHTRSQIQTQPTVRFQAGSRVPMPDPCPLDARAIYTAMDKGFNPKPQQPKTNDETNVKVAA